MNEPAGNVCIEAASNLSPIPNWSVPGEDRHELVGRMPVRRHAIAGRQLDAKHEDPFLPGIPASTAAWAPGGSAGGAGAHLMSAGSHARVRGRRAVPGRAPHSTSATRTTERRSTTRLTVYLLAGGSRERAYRSFRRIELPMRWNAPLKRLTSSSGATVR